MISQPLKLINEGGGHTRTVCNIRTFQPTASDVVAPHVGPGGRGPFRAGPLTALLPQLVAFFDFNFQPGFFCCYLPPHCVSISVNDLALLSCLLSLVSPLFSLTPVSFSKHRPVASVLLTHLQASCSDQTVTNIFGIAYKSLCCKAPTFLTLPYSSSYPQSACALATLNFSGVTELPSLTPLCFCVSFPLPGMTLSLLYLVTQDPV